MVQDRFDPQAIRAAEQSEVSQKLEIIISKYSVAFEALKADGKQQCIDIAKKWIPITERLEQQIAEGEIEDAEAEAQEAQQENDIIKDIEPYFPFVASLSAKEKMEFVLGFFSFIQRKIEAN